ncbi:hypothetical protein BCT32_09970 [Vibrio sp. 10N.261.45.E11]|nr:hypothetical protein BCT34_06040 [Vibrio sp. 10N.261.45.E2]PMN47432.1 hypothetical protein BCT32_09970 [Vibrio sp. 10N.261.45.E11]
MLEIYSRFIMRVNNTPIPSDSCTALVALERAGYEVKSECRNGFCGACRLKASGTPTYLNDPIGYMQDGEVLVCCVDSQSDIDIELP